MRKLLFALVILTTQAGAAVKYVPANDSQPLIRRDLIPMDVGAIRELATNLAILADGPTPHSPALLRNRVQTITLSQRLSPTQPRARSILSDLASGQERPKIDEKHTKSAKRDLLSSASWLIKLPAESQGHHLGQLLLDILQPIAGNESILKLRTTKEAPKRWEGVVAETSAFDIPSKITPPKEAPLPTPEAPALTEPTYAVTTVLTEVPMLTQAITKDSPLSPGLIQTNLVITEGKGQGQLRLKPDPGYPTQPLQTTLQAFFEKIESPLPKAHNLDVNTGRRHSASNQDNLAAPLAMMLDSALSGRTLRRNTLFFAKLLPNGSLQKPAQVWPLLLDLAKLDMPDDSRLIVGSGMLQEMTALLVLEKAPFFTKYEVIEAPTFAAARELFYQDGKASPRLTSAIAGYQEIREKAKLATNINTYLNLSAVETRLIKARAHSPLHLSARMLATQAIRPPASFTRFMFAQELDHQLEGISKLQPTSPETAEREIKDAYIAARKTLAPLARLVERSERLILDDAIDLLKKLNSLGRVGSSSFEIEEQIQRTADLKTFHLELTSFRSKLRQIYLPPIKEK